MSDTLEQFLSNLGLQKYLEAFEKASIDIDVLGDLDGADFRELGVSLGDQKRICKAAAGSRSNRDVVERRFLSLLFIDLVGSTELSVRMDPEDYRQAMFAYQSKCEEILERQGGHLARKFGDGILVYFGFPQSRENDTRRAAEAALEIVNKVPAMSHEVGIPLQVRVGIATGLALVDENLTDDGRERGQVFGETPNLAARLHALAKPNTIVVCEPTHSVLADHFELDDLGHHDLKGLPDPVRAWVLTGQTERTAGKKAGPRPNARPILNRLTEIKDVQEAWAEVLDHKGQVVVLDGCAGIGKSSLVGHLIDILDDDDPYTVYWQCDIDQRGRPLHPVAAHLEREIVGRAVFLNGDEALATQEWLSTYCKEIDGAEVLLASILMAGGSVAGDIGSAEARAQMFEFLFGYLTTLQAQNPVKLVIEDLHWIDPTTLEFLEELIARVPELRILILCSQRDTEPVALPLGDHVTCLHLEALNEDLSRQILERELEDIEAPGPLKAQILERCEGIPLYIEEVARAVLESNRRVAGETLTIPDRALDLHRSDLPSSLLGPLLSRLDSRTGARELASVAATIGRRFSVKMLGYVMNTTEPQMRETLSQLVSAQILRRLNDGQYEFGHSVMQDAAYQVLLKDRRIDAHRIIADVVQSEFAGTPDARPANVAHHYAAAEMWPEARSFWINAALEMQHFGAHREAVEYCARALEANMRGFSGDIQRDNEIEIRELMFASQESSTWWSEEYIENLRQIRELRTERGEVAEQLTVVNGLAGAHLLAGEIAEASHLAQQMLKLENCNQQLAQIFSHRILGICEFYSNNFEGAVDHFEQTMTLSQKTDQQLLKQYYNADVSLVAQVFILWIRILQGRTKDAERLMQPVLNLMEESDELSQMYALSLLASCHQAKGDPEQTIALSDRAVALAAHEDQTYWHAWATIMNGWGAAMIGDGDAGIAKILAGIAEYEAAGTKQIVPYARVLLCEAYAKAGKTEEVADLLTDLEASLVDHEIRFVDPMVSALRAKFNAYSG